MKFTKSDWLFLLGFAVTEMGLCEISPGLGTIGAGCFLLLGAWATNDN